MFIKFGSHRQREYGLRAIERRPQGFWSLKRSTARGVYEVTEAEAVQIREHAQFTVLRAPYDDLLTCWSD